MPKLMYVLQSHEFVFSGLFKSFGLYLIMLTEFKSRSSSCNIEFSKSFKKKTLDSIECELSECLIASTPSDALAQILTSQRMRKRQSMMMKRMNFFWVVVQKSRVAPVMDDNWKNVTGSWQQQSSCLRNSDCSTGLYCFACLAGGVSEWQPKCTRDLATPTSAFPKVCALTFNSGALHRS